MKTVYKTILTTSIIAAFSAAAAGNETPKNPLSVHVLNLQTGTPTPGIAVDLEQKQAERWVKLASGITDENGRIGALFPTGKTISHGDYKVVFKTGDYYQKAKQSTFFPEIPVIFHVEKDGDHYHIPLLLSSYGYSTYRGN